MNTNRIDYILNKFLEEFDCKAQLGREFEYLTESHIIKYSFFVDSVADPEFVKSFHRIDNDIIADNFLYSFFHELGHHFTLDDVTEREWRIYNKTTEKMEKILQKKVKPQRLIQINRKYFKLAVERRATEWACWYMREHCDSVAKLWNELQPAIIDFYKEMGVEF